MQENEYEYIAIEKNTENTIAVTMFYEGKTFGKNDVSNIAFIGIDENIIIEGFQIEDLDQTDNKYSSYSITLNYKANEVGIFETSGIIINLTSNKSIEYSIGDWVIDVNEQTTEVIDTWSSPVASSNKNEFPYDYLIIEPNYKIKEIHYGPNQYIGNEPESQGVINLEYYSSPIVYIKSKVILEKDGSKIINYGKGCFCGAIGLSEEVITASKERYINK